MKQIAFAAALAAFSLGGCAGGSFSNPPRAAVGSFSGAHPGPSWAPRLKVAAADFAWLEGCWMSADGDQFEGWGPANSAGARAGLAVISTGGVEAFREAMVLSVDRGQARLTAQLPEGEPTVYHLAGAGEGWMRVENPRHDDPKVIIYDRDLDRLRAWIGDGPSATRIVLDATRIDCPRAG